MLCKGKRRADRRQGRRLKAGKGVTVAHTVEEALDALDIAFAQEGTKWSSRSA